MPAVTLSACEHFQVWAGAYRLHDRLKFFGLPSVLATRPAPPVPIHPPFHGQLSPAAEQYRLDTAAIRATESKPHRLFQPVEHYCWLETPCPRHCIRLLDVAVYRPDVAVRIIISRHGQSADFFDAHRRILQVFYFAVVLARVAPFSALHHAPLAVMRALPSDFQIPRRVCHDCFEFRRDT